MNNRYWSDWFSLGWYCYLFHPPNHYPKPTWEYHDFMERLLIIRCRIKGHPSGVVYYRSSPVADEPDWHCQDCGEDLG